MANLISKVFDDKDKKFVTFVTGGDPDIKTSEEIILRLIKNNIDIIRNRNAIF